MAYRADDPIVQAAIAAGDWIPANGGSEEPTTDGLGRRVLYVWHPATGKHAYLDLSTDTILEDPA